MGYVAQHSYHLYMETDVWFFLKTSHIVSLEWFCFSCSLFILSFPLSPPPPTKKTSQPQSVDEVTERGFYWLIFYSDILYIRYLVKRSHLDSLYEESWVPVFHRQSSVMNKHTKSHFLWLTVFHSLSDPVQWLWVWLLMYAFHVLLANSSRVNEHCKGKWILVNLCVL